MKIFKKKKSALLKGVCCSMIILFYHCSYKQCETIFNDFKINSDNLACDCISVKEKKYHKVDPLLNDHFYKLIGTVSQECSNQFVNHLNQNNDWKKGRIDNYFIKIIPMSLEGIIPIKNQYFYYFKYKIDSTTNKIYWYNLSIYNIEERKLSYFSFEM